MNHASVPPAATRESRKHQPPGPMIPFKYPETFSPEEYTVIRRGLIPREMEDKWFIFCEDEWLSFHRSWTGFCVYRLQFQQVDDQYRVTQAFVRAPSPDKPQIASDFDT